MTNDQKGKEGEGSGSEKYDGWGGVRKENGQGDKETERK